MSSMTKVDYCAAVSQQFTRGMDQPSNGMNDAFANMKQLQHMNRLDYKKDSRADENGRIASGLTSLRSSLGHPGAGGTE